MMKVGLVGMPNAGKSSLFNALSQAGAEAANYPFTTIEPNVAVVPVKDDRMEQVAKTVKSSNIVWDTIEFHDIAGLVAGASKGEGLGNKFLANIRECDALLHVVRTHTDENVIHPDGRVDPAADIETIETELLLADLDTAERRHAKVIREARSGDKRGGRRGGVAAPGDRGPAVRQARPHGPGPARCARRDPQPVAAHRQAGAVRRQRRRRRRRRAVRGRRPRRRHRRRGGRDLLPRRGRAVRARRRRGDDDARGARRRRVRPATASSTAPSASCA